MSLRVALNAAERPRPLPAKLGALQLTATAEKLAHRWSAIDRIPQPLTIDEIVRRFRAAFAERAYDRLTARDWRLLPWALWHGAPPLAADAALLGAYERRLRSNARCSEVKALIGAYLREFDPRRPGFTRLAGLLAELAGRWDWPWRSHHESLRLFDPQAAPARLAAHCLAEPAGPAAGLAALGLARFSDQGLPIAALAHALEQLRAELAAAPDAIPRPLDTILAWSRDPEAGVRPGIRARLAEALLLPWAARPPAAELRRRLRGFLLEHYGDPRLRPQRWHGVAGDACTIFRKWLVEIALDQFFGVIDRLALEQHWRYRRAFWSAYLRREWITEAQVMFASHGYAMARKLFGAELSCARLTKGRKQVEPGHAVLLLRIGRLIVADWSHNGRCAIWQEGDASAPAFGRAEYSSDDVNADLTWNVRHAGTDSYSWQRKARNYIRQQTGLRLDDREFQLDDRDRRR